MLLGYKSFHKIRVSNLKQLRNSFIPFPSTIYKTPKLNHHLLPCTAFSSSATELNTIQPKIPLSQRPPVHTAQLAHLLEWRDAAAQKATSIGSSWEDGAPSTEDLHTELSWLIEDNVVAISSPQPDVNNTDTTWMEIPWKDIERNIKNISSSQHTTTPFPTDKTAHSQLIRLRESIEELDKLWTLRIEKRVPLQYLTASAFWRDLVLSVGNGVLIPRPETELIIDFVDEAIKARPHLQNGQWADLGTGSGALAIGIARAVPAVPRVWAVDLAAEPAAHAAFNAERVGVSDRVRVVRGSWYEPIENQGVTRLAGIVSNPPYVTQDQLTGLQAEVGQHEPELALSGGEGLGVDSLLPICLGAVKMLQSGGFLALETAGGEQAEYIAHLLAHLKDNGGDAGDDEESMAFTDVAVRKDLRGVDRFVVATRQ